MAIRIIEGVPGSGKTYYAVRHLAKHYFKQQKDGSYELSKPCTLITNIDSFQPDHLSLQDEIKHAGGVEHFFSFDYQEKYKEGKEQLVYIIDEAQRFFRKGQRNLNEVFSYFEYHRHWGQDIYLVTQNARKLPPDLVYLTEYLIVAAPRTRSILGEFKYKWISEGEIIKREGFRPDQGVFNLYKSMDVGESEKIKNPVMKTVYIVLTIVVLVVFSGYKFFTSKWQPDHNQKSIHLESIKSTDTVPVNVSGRVSPTSPTPKIDYEVFIPLNFLTQFSELNGHLKTTFLFVWKHKFYSYSSFPYPLKRFDRQWFAVLDKSIFDLTFNDDNRPSNVIIRPKKAVESGEI